MMRILFTLFAALLTTTLLAQERSGHWCATTEANKTVQEQNPDAYDASLARVDQVAKQMLADASYKNQIDDGRPFLIPVVMHVFHRLGNAPISETRINDFISTLNKNFNPNPSDVENIKRRIHDEYDEVIGSANIKFVLAESDPKGNPTNGITINEWEYADGNGVTRDEVKYQIQWAPARYLNIWVVEAIGSFTNNPDQQVLGFAQFPQSFDAGGVSAKATDGVVIRADQVNRSSTTGTHEVGHYLGLYHPFQGNDPSVDTAGTCTTGDCHLAGDRICDIDQANGPYWVCDQSANTCVLDDRRDPIHNYMMYTPDNCHAMFSKEQVVRMRATLFTLRYKLSSWENINSIGIGQPTESEKMQVDAYPNPFTDQINIDINVDQAGEICISIKDLLGRTIQKDCRKKLNKGRNHLILSASDMNISERGIYLLELQMADKVVVTQIQYQQ